ncbi:CCA tRNA nucleotidyltransferase, mitochondrial [Batrachochytrium dendrobatidis]|nr:CCA tRNA nucleotidyltransferase, mitochondrial [Batrachochytrium dendrobatidis]KAK5665278.1 CCA tRNA nucleotidyltransferase, mitochondrial [Batrachochytrium dendrobatidis]
MQSWRSGFAATRPTVSAVFSPPIFQRSSYCSLNISNRLHTLTHKTTMISPFATSLQLQKNTHTIPRPATLLLTETESQILQLLSETATHIHANNPDQPPLVLRVAGGWVRDKLLGRTSDDIDIAIDTMKGEPFARHLKEYMLSKSMSLGTIYTIQVNPDRSKHLETATVRVLGRDLDFVHLRTEIYDENSRNPIVEFGTPLQDALRRDITINTLFYNLNTREVEDMTGHGLDDLSAGLIRTPLEPLSTFVDDPLRVLRVIRFATRFGYEIVSNILKAASDDLIKTAFIKKISRERIGVELNKMLEGPDPVRAIKILQDIEFYPLVFLAPPNICQETVVHEKYAYVANYILKLMIQKGILAEMGISQIPLSLQDSRNLHLAATVLPYQGLTFRLKNKYISVVRHVVGTSIRLSKHDGDTAHALLDSSLHIRDLANQNFYNDGNTDRTTLGMFVRELGARPLGEKWDLAVLMALVHQLTEIAFELADPSQFSLNDEKVVHAIAVYSKLLTSIMSHQVYDTYNTRPLLDGKEIATILGVKLGPQIGRYLYHVMEWQLSHVNSTKEQCVEFVKARFGHHTNAAANSSKPSKSVE